MPLPEIGNLVNKGSARGELAFLGIQVVTLQVSLDTYVWCPVKRSGRDCAVGNDLHVFDN